MYSLPGAWQRAVAGSAGSLPRHDESRGRSDLCPGRSVIEFSLRHQSWAIAALPPHGSAGYRSGAAAVLDQPRTAPRSTPRLLFHHRGGHVPLGCRVPPWRATMDSLLSSGVSGVLALRVRLFQQMLHDNLELGLFRLGGG